MRGRLRATLPLALLATGSLAVAWVGCAHGRPPWERYDRIPLPQVLAMPHGEQPGYLERHGPPDIVWDLGYEVTVWSYCRDEITVRTISFDRDGRVLQHRCAQPDDPRGLIGCAWLCRPERSGEAARRVPGSA